MKNYPFSLKELPDIQKKLFRRAHGIKATLNANGNTDIEFVIPYSWAKITTMEIIDLPEMMSADLTIHADIDGKFKQSIEGPSIPTGVSKYKLNQFCFDVNVSKSYYKDHSEYDADLFQGMIIRVTIKNHTNLTPTVGINLTLHEVV